MVGIIYKIDIPLTYTGRTYHISTDNVKKLNELMNKKVIFSIVYFTFSIYNFLNIQNIMLCIFKFLSLIHLDITHLSNLNLSDSIKNWYLNVTSKSFIPNHLNNIISMLSKPL